MRRNTKRTKKEKQSLTDLYKGALQKQQQQQRSPSTVEDVDPKFAPFLVKKDASRAEFAFVTNKLTKSKVEWIQGRIIAQCTSNLHKAITRLMDAIILKAIREQHKELLRFIHPSGAPLFRWKDGSIRRPAGSFSIRDDADEHPYDFGKIFCILEVNHAGSSAAIFRNKLEEWIAQTEDVVVVIGLDLKPSSSLLGATSSSSSSSSVLVYHYVRSSCEEEADEEEDFTTAAVSKFVEGDGKPTFARAPPLLQLDMDVKSMFRSSRGLYNKLYPNMDGRHLVEPNLRVSLAVILDCVLRRSRYLCR